MEQSSITTDPKTDKPLDDEEYKKRLTFWEYLEITSVCVLIFLILHMFVIMFVYVPTASMEPTVTKGGRYILSRLAYKTGEPKRGDIIGFYAPDEPDQIYLKRIIGLPCETIRGEGGIVYINDKPIEDYTDIIFTEDFGPFLIPEDSYFVMGDNRNDSLDSRYWSIPFVSRDSIQGKLIFEFFPKMKVYK